MLLQDTNTDTWLKVLSNTVNDTHTNTNESPNVLTNMVSFNDFIDTNTGVSLSYTNIILILIHD